MNVSVAAFIVALLIAFYAFRWLRLRQIRPRVRESLAGYFNGDIGLSELAKHTREMAGRRFAASPELQALVQEAFQHAVETKLKPYSLEVERKLLTALAAAKTEFGLPDRYQSEGWKAGRE